MHVLREQESRRASARAKLWYLLAPFVVAVEPYRVANPQTDLWLRWLGDGRCRRRSVAVKSLPWVRQRGVAKCLGWSSIGDGTQWCEEEIATAATL